jgi:hypothetical protein
MTKQTKPDEQQDGEQPAVQPDPMPLSGGVYQRDPTTRQLTRIVDPTEPPRPKRERAAKKPKE